MNDVPLDEAMDMKKKGLSKSNIEEDLKNKGYDSRKVSDAMNQADIKSSVGGDAQPSVLDQDIPVPEPPQEENLNEVLQKGPVITSQPRMNITQPAYQGASQEELIESIIEEKWQMVIDSVGDIEIWKSRMDNELAAVKQEILRLGNRLENMQRSVLGKVNEYNQSISDVGVEIKALEKVMQNILQPLTSNIKELSKISSEIKKNKK